MLVNSRHPDPRRVWKGGSEQHWMTPDPGIPGIPIMSSKNAYLIAIRGTSELATSPGTGDPEAGQRESPGHPKRSPRAPQKEPKGTPKEPKGAPKEPKGTQKEPKGTPKEPKGTPKEPKGAPKELSE